MRLKLAPDSFRIYAAGYGGDTSYPWGLSGLADGDTSSGDFIDVPDPSTLTPVDTGTFLSNLPTVGVPTDVLNTPVGSNAPTPAGGGLTAAQIAAIIQAGGQTAIKAYQLTQQPSVVPGSSLVYNPATGQFVPASGTLNTATAVSSNLVPLGIAAVVVIGLVIAMRRN